jgi:hypothetical protein
MPHVWSVGRGVAAGSNFLDAAAQRSHRPHGSDTSRVVEDLLKTTFQPAKSASGLDSIPHLYLVV